MKRFLLLFFLLISTLIYSQKERLYQFKSNEEGKSFFITEGGSHLSLSLHLNNVELTGGYSFILGSGFNLSSDLYLYNFNFTEELKLNIGVGGGLIFKSSLIDESEALKKMDFQSDILLRVPLRFSWNNFFIKITPMAGVSMFKQIMEFKFPISFGIGYMFDLAKSKKIEEKKEPPASGGPDN